MNSSFLAKLEILADSGHKLRFPSHGLGSILANILDKNLLGASNQFPDPPRGRTLVIVGDFGGNHRRQHFDTYSFLLLDLDRNAGWLNAQRRFRRAILPNARRMSFKAMNDNQRRRALVPFLQTASEIDGCLVQFAISKAGGSLFNGASEVDEPSSLLSMWKPRVQERLLRIVHLSAFLVSGLSVPNQDLLWIIDEDDIAANDNQLTQLTKVFGTVFSNYASHGLRHIRCGTTRSDSGSLWLEDLAAIADLATGTLGEVCTGFIDQSRFPRRGLIVPAPTGLTWKARLITSWMAAQDRQLRRHTSVIELAPNSSKTRVTTVGWNAFEGQIVLPRSG